MSARLARNVAALSACIGIGILAIHGARMLMVFNVFAGSMSFPGVLGLDGVYIVAWIPPFGASLLMGILMLWIFRAHAVRWAAGYGLVMGAIWLLGTTHAFYGTPGDFQEGFLSWATEIFGIYSWYAMPLAGAVLGAYVARRLAR